MVPSDPFDSSPTAGMHDLGTAAKRAERRLLCSPSPLLPETAQSSRARLLTLPSRDRRFLTAFLSPATTSRSPGRHSEVKDPDLPFQHLPDFHQARSEETPLAGRFPVQLPVVPSRCLASTRPTGPPCEPPLPFGAFYSRPDRSVQSVQLPDSPPSRLARFPFAPRNRL